MKAFEVEMSNEEARFVEAEIAHGGFASADDYFAVLIADRMERLERLRAAIQEGIDSPDSGLSPEEIFIEARERHRSRAA